MNDIGKAALVSINFETGEQLHTIFTEEYEPNPVQSCWDLKTSLAPDFPDAHFSVIANERAKEIQSQSILEALGVREIRTATSTLGDGEVEEIK